MGLNIHTSHRLTFGISAGVYLVLVFFCAILPAMTAWQEQEKYEKPELTPLVARGRQIYRRYNCVTCHTMQIRGEEKLRIEVDGVEIIPVLAADARFGRESATTAEDYHWQDPVYMGTQRTGPDLITVGKRLPFAQWHYWHLYDPRSVSPDSIMPPYRFLFTKTPPPEGAVGFEEVTNIRELGLAEGEQLWATPDCVALVEYLLSLTRDPLQEKREQQDGEGAPK